MSNSSSSGLNGITKLNNSNYPQWQSDMASWLRLKGLGLLVKGEEPIPDEKEAAGRLDWKKRVSQAAGALALAMDFY